MAEELRGGGVLAVGNLKVISVKLPLDMLAEIETIAAHMGITRSEAIRRAIKLWLRYNRSSIPVKRVRLDA